MDDGGKRVKKTILSRAVIYIKDIMLITGKSERTACRIAKEIRDVKGKVRGQVITIGDFSSHMGMTEEEVRSYLIN